MAPSELFCSTIIPTIGRSSIDRAVESVISQQFGQPFEVIVVNDSGLPLAPARWQQAAGVQVIDTQKRERSVARNVGAMVAHGRYLHFLDDDDWLLPGALEAWAGVAAHSSAAWLYGAAQLTDPNGRCLFQFDHELNGNCLMPVMAGEWVPLQASLIATTAFFAVGGFDRFIVGVEDKDLLMRVAQRFDLAGTPTPVAGILRGVWDSSTNWSAIARGWHRACEHILNEPGTGRRLRASTTNAYWHGRLFRLYLLSAWQQAKQGRPITAAARALHAADAFVRAGPRLLSGAFWRAVSHPHLTAGFVPPETPALPVSHLPTRLAS
jgi:glycosyltransferase involved in cell wall biosynthesis